MEPSRVCQLQDLKLIDPSLDVVDMDLGSSAAASLLSLSGQGNGPQGPCVLLDQHGVTTASPSSSSGLAKQPDMVQTERFSSPLLECALFPSPSLCQPFSLHLLGSPSGKQAEPHKHVSSDHHSEEREPSPVHDENNHHSEEREPSPVRDENDRHSEEREPSPVHDENDRHSEEREPCPVHVVPGNNTMDLEPDTGQHLASRGTVNAPAMSVGGEKHDNWVDDDLSDEGDGEALSLLVKELPAELSSDGGALGVHLDANSEFSYL
jgi:hypothetical protein